MTKQGSPPQKQGCTSWWLGGFRRRTSLVTFSSPSPMTPDSRSSHNQRNCRLWSREFRRQGTSCLSRSSDPRSVTNAKGYSEANWQVQRDRFAGRWLYLLDNLDISDLYSESEGVLSTVHIRVIEGDGQRYTISTSEDIYLLKRSSDPCVRSLSCRLRFRRSRYRPCYPNSRGFTWF